METVSGISTDQNNEHLYCIPLERLKHIDLVQRILKKKEDIRYKSILRIKLVTIQVM